jgi:hypothetical protein|tara:strand:+ start:33 stop:377 length:345 start_codon:yes stop_codon:yes gene_type:complete
MNEVNMREVLEQATMFVGINKITRKNTKLFNKRLKILRFAGLHIFDHVKLSDIEEHIDLSTDAKKMSPSDFKNTVWASMEEGAEILIQEQENPSEILESQDTSSDQNEQVEQQD